MFHECFKNGGGTSAIKEIFECVPNIHKVVYYTSKLIKSAVGCLDRSYGTMSDRSLIIGEERVTLYCN